MSGRILVVDDEEKIRLIIRKYGEFEGYEIDEAANGMEVVENPDVDSFRAAVQSVYDAYPDYADYITRIQDALK